MIQEKLICHASGDFSKPFILGFYLYHVVQDKENQRGMAKYLLLCCISKCKFFCHIIYMYFPAGDTFSPSGDLQSFENEWVEVEIKAPKGWCEPTSPATFSTISSPISIPNCDTVDESNVLSFLKDDLDLADTRDDKEWRGNFKYIILYFNYPILCSIPFN